MSLSMKRISIGLVFLSIFGVIIFILTEKQGEASIIRSFDDCVRAGHAVIDSVPKRCEVSEGQYIVNLEKDIADTSSAKGSCAHVTFSSYPADDMWNKTPALVDFNSYPAAANFRNAIQDGAANGPNFAGKFTIVGWSCGANCEDHAIIDAETGKILVFGFVSNYGIDSRKDSTLLVVNPQKNIPSKENIEKNSVTTNYFKLENSGLVFLCRESAY